MSSYLAIGKVYGGDVDNLLSLCDLVGDQSYHVAFFAEEIKKLLELWPVYLNDVSLLCVLKKTYRKALKKHRKLNLYGPLPICMQYFRDSSILRFRCSDMIVTLDISESLILIQSYSESIVRNLASKAGIGMVFKISGKRVLFPKEVLDLKIQIGAVVDSVG